MEDLESYKGFLIAAHPKRAEPSLRKGVILIIDQDHTGSIGLQINKPLESNTTLGSVMTGLGMSLDKDQPLYFGGTENTNRIIVLHTLDWRTSSTTELGENIGISNDISVLSAISANSGPAQYRAIAGYTRWMPGNLEAEIEMIPPFNEVSRSWSYLKADVDLCFDSSGSTQWHHILEESARIQIASWL